MAIRLQPTISRQQLRYIPLLAAGVSLFVGLVTLGDLLGVLRHVELPLMFGEWVKLSPSVQEYTAQWMVWGVCQIIAISPGVVAIARRRTKPVPIAVLTLLFLPLLSLLMVYVSRHLGSTLLVGCGFLVAYTVTSSSRILLDIDPCSARRLVCATVFALLASTATGGVICVLLWQAGALFASTSHFSQAVTGVLVGVFAADLKTFYLLQPLLTAIFLTVALVAAAALVREPVRRLAELFANPLLKRRAVSKVQPFRRGNHASLAYLTLLGGLVLGIAVTLYPLLQLHWPGGADFPWYIGNLHPVGSLRDAVAFLHGDRGLFLLLLSLVADVTSVTREDVVRFAPAILSVMLALSTFLLVREGTGRVWVSSFAGVLSVVSAQTTLGMYGGILANWFALSIANFTFAMVIRSIRLRLPLMAVSSIALSLVLLAGYAYQWVVAVVELLLALAGSAASSRIRCRSEWKYDFIGLSGLILGILLIPVLVFIAATPLLGIRLEALDASAYLAMGCKYAQAATSETIGSALSTLVRSLSEGRMALPFVALLSILGLLDHVPQSRLFTRIIAAMVLVPFAIELVTNAPFYFPLRGLYMVPLYMLAALGAESVVRTAGLHERPEKITSHLPFAATITTYLVLSQLGYTLMMYGLPLPLT